MLSNKLSNLLQSKFSVIIFGDEKLNIFDKPTRTHESNEYEIKYLIEGTIYTQNLYDPNVDLSNATCKVYHLQNMNPYNMYYGCTRALYIDNMFFEVNQICYRSP